MNPVTAADLQKLYAQMSVEALSRVERSSLSDIARDCYDLETAFRASPEGKQRELDALIAAQAAELAETCRCFFWQQFRYPLNSTVFGLQEAAVREGRTGNQQLSGARDGLYPKKLPSGGGDLN